MPKELTHWWLAAEAVEQLAPDSPLRKLLHQEWQLYLTGAVLPDTLLHLVTGNCSATALASADRFHDPPGSSYQPLIRFLEDQGSGTKGQTPDDPCPLDTCSTQAERSRSLTLDPAIIACLLGVAAHIEADIVCHPFVYALAGTDMARHYTVETGLDLWLLATDHKPPVLQLRDLVDQRAQDTAVTVLGGLFDPAGVMPKQALQQALSLHCLIQGMYGSLGWQLAAGLLALLPVPFLRSRHKLFYPLGWKRGRTGDWPERWQHPVNGVTSTKGPQELMNDAVAKIARMLAQVEVLGIAEAFAAQAGENLLTGLIPDRTSRAAAATVPP